MAAGTRSRSGHIGLAILVVMAAIVPAIVNVHPALAATNPIPVENAQPGTTSWQIDPSVLAGRRQIEGYASATSVAQGGTINFMVSVTVPQNYSISFYRMGYYGGTGGRLMATAGPLAGSYQGLPAAGPAPEYLVEANWPVSYTLNVPPSWVSGYYLAKLVRADGWARYVIFVVRNDTDPAPIVMTAAFNTYAAYSMWGGYSLYGQFYYDYTKANFGTSVSNGPLPASVSYNRPFDDVDEQDGAGQFFNWEYSMVRYMEAQGRWVTYVTSVDLQTAGLLTVAGRKTFLSVGHDEYWSGEARTTVTAARDAGINLLWLSANQVYWKIRMTADGAGNANRRIYCYKNGNDPVSGTGTTGYWSSYGQPENSLIGSVYGNANWQGASPYVVTNSGLYSWVYNGTGLVAGSSIAGVVGAEYEVSSPNNGFSPSGLQVIAHGPTSDGGIHEAVAYTASSGAIVINLGTFQWSWGLDGYSNPSSAKASSGLAVNAAMQGTTANILDRFTGVTGGSPTLPAPPGGVSAVAGNASATVSWSAPNSGGSPITAYRVTPIGAGAPGPTTFNSTATSQTVGGLTNGNSYTFTVAAINSVGTGPDSAASNAVVPASVPGAPTAVGVVAGNSSVAVSWTAPASNGGSGLTSYVVTTTGIGAPAPITFNSTATSQTIGGLTNGNSYTFTVAAVNGIGTGPNSASSPSATPVAGVPSPPTGVGAVAGNTIATVSWTAPANNGGSAITGYRLTTNGTGAPAPITYNSVATTQTVSGLTNGASYTFTVAAINGIGTGNDSTASTAVVPYTAGNATLIQSKTIPTILNTTTAAPFSQPVTAGDSLMLLVAFPGAWGDTVKTVTDSFGSTWTRAMGTPAADGCGDDAEIWTARSNGTGANSVNVTLTKAAGSWVNWNLTIAEFQGPTIVGSSGATNLTGSAHSVTVGGVRAGDLAVAMYVDCGYNTTITPSAGWSQLGTNQANTSSQAGTNQVYQLNLAAGSTTVTFTTSASTPAEVLLVEFATSAGPPGPPTGVVGTASSGQATVSWTAPVSNGGSSLTGYRVTTTCTSPDGTASQPCAAGSTPGPIVFNSTATSQTIGSLVNGNTYTFSVAAINGVGTGPESASSTGVVPASVSNAPTNVSATAGNGSATVSWLAPSNNGGMTITGYRVTPIGTGAPAPTTFNSTVATQTVSVPVGNSYTFTVAALNGLGWSAESVPSNAVVPFAGPPGAPSGVTASGGSASATVSWTAPSITGGSPVTGYRITTAGSGAPAPVTFNSAATSQTVGGLTNGSAYTFTVAAINSAGISPESMASNSVTPLAVATTALIQSKTQGGLLTNTGVVAFANPVAAGDTLLVMIAFPATWGDGVRSVADSLGNSWTRIAGTPVADACSDVAEIWSTRATSSGADTVTAVLTRASGSWVNWTLTLSEFKGGMVVDATGATNVNSTIHTASVAGAKAGDYAVAMYVDCGYNATITPSAGWSQLGTNLANPNWQPGTNQVYQLGLPAGGTSVTFTTSASAPAEVLIAALTPI